MALAGVATVARLHDEIREVRYREATTTFCRLVSEQARPLRATIKEAIAAAAPYVQVPSHMMRLPSGEMPASTTTTPSWAGAARSR